MSSSGATERPRYRTPARDPRKQTTSPTPAFPSRPGRRSPSGALCADGRGRRRACRWPRAAEPRTARSTPTPSGHRGVHLLDGDGLEQHVEVVERVDGHADLADLETGDAIVRVVPAPGRQIEGNGEAGLALGEVRPIELVAGLGARVPRVRAGDPRRIARDLSLLVRRSGGQGAASRPYTTPSVFRRRPFYALAGR